jgi:hypothetical protein
MQLHIGMAKLRASGSTKEKVVWIEIGSRTLNHPLSRPPEDLYITAQPTGLARWMSNRKSDRVVPSIQWGYFIS